MPTDKSRYANDTVEESSAQVLVLFVVEKCYDVREDDVVGYVKCEKLRFLCYR